MSALSVPELLQEVRKYGRFDVGGCFNCGSCTVVCDLSNGSASFPRRAMQQTLLGLKGPLLESLEPWLCHDCGDCSIACPRQAEPRDSMMTLRRYLAAQYDPTGLSARFLRSKAWEMMGILLVGALVLTLVVLYHLYYLGLYDSGWLLSDFASTPMPLKHMFGTIVYFTWVVFLIPALVLIINAIRMHRFTMSGKKIPLRLYVIEARTIVLHMVSHENIRKCAQAIYKKRWAKHWLLGLACTLMFVIKFFFLDWFQTDSIYPIYHPQRWLGYFAAAILIYVPLDIFICRIKKREEFCKVSEFSDLTLPVMLLLVAVSGLAVHVLRYLEFSLASHYAYAIHLAIAVPLLVVEIPFGKLSHMIYRPLALYFQAVKERALVEEKSLVTSIPEEAIAA